jgi:hypothetical protein
LQVIQQIVSSRNGGEKVVDLGGTLMAGRIEDVAHAGILHDERFVIKGDKITLLGWMSFAIVRPQLRPLDYNCNIYEHRSCARRKEEDSGH